MRYGDTSVKRSFPIYATRRVDSPWKIIQIARHISKYRASPECITIMKSWMSTCLDSHPRCHTPAMSILPDRILEISPCLDLQLIENFSGEATGNYIALSHCWGGQVAMQLTSQTVNEFKQKIFFNDLPKTFQDAVTICVALDISYIWIDSLCILQDSLEDWAVQGSKMAQVYSACLLTIAADAAMNSTAGFLQRTPDPSESTVVWPKSNRAQAITPEDHQEYRVHVRKSRGITYMGGFPHHSAIAYGNTSNDPDDEHLGGYLSRRGWCFQEGYLPSRVLHFAIDHVSWHCATDAFCECANGPIDKNKKRSRAFANGLGDRGRIIDRDNLKEDWKGVIEEYTRRRLTFSSDRLAAVAGLAARAHAAHPEIEYLAGLWSDTLPQSLLWEADNWTASERIRPHIAPSWSWASVTGPVSWPLQDNFDTKDRTRLEIIAFNCLPAGPNKYGALKDARLVVKGFLWPVRLLVADGSGFERMQILGEDCTTSIYDMPDGGRTWDVYDEIRASGETTSSCESDDSAECFSNEEAGDSDEEFDDEEDESVQECHSDGSSSSDEDDLLEAEGEFALLNVVGDKWSPDVTMAKGKGSGAKKEDKASGNGKGKGKNKSGGCKDEKDTDSGTKKSRNEIYVRHILCEKYSKKERALERLREGDAWDTVALEFAEHAGTKGGLLGWKTKQPRSLKAEFEKVAFDLEPSMLKNPNIGEAKTDQGYHLIVVTDRR
ncbi:heterokaryon incompatibility protein-domain-containing protein [Diaporthe sp. PMI_573]|nr:heterokaryon incompatibility protein-domain-containing protein [Diaporthaceae sp. PMI_573]